MAAFPVKRGVVYGDVVSPDGSLKPTLHIDVPAYIEAAPDYEARLRQIAGLVGHIDVLANRRTVLDGQTAVDNKYLVNLRHEVQRLQGLHKANGRLHNAIKQLKDSYPEYAQVREVIANLVRERDELSMRYRRLAEQKGVGQIINLPPGLKLEGNTVVVDSLTVLGAHCAQQERVRQGVPPDAVNAAIAEAQNFYERWGTCAGAGGCVRLSPVR